MTDPRGLALTVYWVWAFFHLSLAAYIGKSGFFFYLTLESFDLDERSKSSKSDFFCSSSEYSSGLFIDPLIELFYLMNIIFSLSVFFLSSGCFGTFLLSTWSMTSLTYFVTLDYIFGFCFNFMADLLFVYMSNSESELDSLANSGSLALRIF